MPIKVTTPPGAAAEADFQVRAWRKKAGTDEWVPIEDGEVEITPEGIEALSKEAKADGNVGR